MAKYIFFLDTFDVVFFIVSNDFLDVFINISIYFFDCQTVNIKF